MGLAKLDESEWLQPDPDLEARAEGFAAYPEGIQLAPEGEAPGAELAAMLGLPGGLPEAARAHHEDMCLLTLRPGDEQYRLVGAAVAWTTIFKQRDSPLQRDPIPDHRRVFEAVAAGDPARAHKAMSDLVDMALADTRRSRSPKRAARG